MKAIFIPTQYTGPIHLEKIPLDKLPKKIGILTTAQFAHKTHYIIDHLKKNKKECFIDKQKQKNPGQLLGCDQGAALAVESDVEALLYIGSGEFHPLGVAMKTDKDVFLFNPVSSVFSKFDRTEIERYQKTKKVKYTRYLAAQNIGILVSIKPGQYSFKKAREIKKELETQGKKAYIFVFDELNPMEMENFNFIDFWISTACPRIADDRDKKNVIDMAEIHQFSGALH